MKNLQNDSDNQLPKILVVDDHHENLVAIKKILNDLEVEIICANSGNEALQKVLEYDFAVILLDVQMPEMDGFEVAECLQEDNSTCNIPIIFITAISKEMSYVHKGHEVGAVDYIFKPVDPLVLRSKVKIFVELYNQRQNLYTLLDELEVAKQELEDSNDRFKNLAHHDALTGLPNRLMYESNLKREVLKSKRNKSKFSLLLVDLDGFKEVNDTYGHDIGDALLKEVALRLKKSVRITDSVNIASDLEPISRLGGDEFAIIVTGEVCVEDVGFIASRILKNLSQPFKSGSNIITVGASIGIASFPEMADTKEGLIKNADIALYRAKDLGKNNYQYFSDTINESHRKRVEKSTDLINCINNNELRYIVEPVCSLDDIHLVGLDIRVDWSKWIAEYMIEDDIYKILRRGNVLEKFGLAMFNFCKKIHKEIYDNFNKKIEVFIDLASIQLLKSLYEIHSPLADFFNSMTNDHIIEIDESQLSDINKFKNNRVQLLLKHFGIGYSSLVNVKQLPVRYIEIDSHFVDDLIKDTGNKIIIKSIIDLAKNLKVTSYAPSINTLEQYQILNELGCKIGAGSYFNSNNKIAEIQNFLSNAQK